MSKPNRTTLFYNEAIKLCTQAVEADDAAQREKAIAYYSASCEYFWPAENTIEIQLQEL